MANLQEVPTDELLSFQDFAPIHDPMSLAEVPPGATTISIDDSDAQDSFDSIQREPKNNPLDDDSPSQSKSLLTLEYYQKFFDVDTTDVVERLLASITPTRNVVVNHKIKEKPDLYGPLWISVTLIFTIAISGNIVGYLQNINSNYHWKYNFHLVSYAATAIVLYVSLIPLLFWGGIKWSLKDSILIGDEYLNDDRKIVPGPLELICLYGYSMFIYIPVSIFLTIQIWWLQWVLVVIAALLSGSVLLVSLIPAFNTSKHKYFMMLSVISLHLLLAAGFMLYFFHVPDIAVIKASVTTMLTTQTIHVHANITEVARNASA